MQTPDYQALPADASTPKEPKSASGKKARAARTARIMGQRFCLASKALARVLAVGAEYVPYIKGRAPKMYDEDGEELQDSDEEYIGSGWNKTSIPAHGMLCSVLSPSLLARKPVYINRARKAASEIERARGRVYAELARVIERESDVHGKMAAALEDTYPNTASWLFVDYDPERQLPVVRHVPCSRVLVDPETDGAPDMRAVRWVAEKRTLPIADARWLAENVWGAKDYEFTPVTQTWDEDDEEVEAEDEVPTRFAKLLFCYIKGNNPNTTAAKIGATADEKVEDSAKDDAYSGKDELLILECAGDEDSYDDYKLVARQPWPFPCDLDELPATPLRLTRPLSGKGFYPDSILQPSHELQKALDHAITFWNTDAFNSCRRFITYNGAIFKDDNDVQRVLGGGDNLALLRGERAVGDQDLRAVNFGQPNPSVEKAFAINSQQYDQVSGKIAFDSEQRNRSHQTATGAAISNESAQVRIGALADMVEECYVSVMRKALQCARRWMNAEQVATWIGEDLMMFETMPTEDGQGVRASPLWNDMDRTPEAIRREVDVAIEPQSIRFVSKDQQANDIQLLMGKQNEAALTIMKTVEMGAIPLAKAMAKASNAAILALAETLHLPNADDFLFDLNAVIPPPPEPAANAGMPGQLPVVGGPQMHRSITVKPDGTRTESVKQIAGEGPHPGMGGGGPTPQALGEILQMVKAGKINPQQLPPQIQAALMQMVQGGG